MNIHHPTSSRQSGFTIVELMIATMVFAVVLLVITVGVTHFTSDYYKGINSSATQTAARTVLTDISRAIEFSGNPVSFQRSGASGTVCAGNQLFEFNLGNELPNAPGYAVRLNTGSANCNPSASQTELLQKNMRLTYINVTPAAGDITGKLWTISVTVAYGDSDLLCDASSGSTHPCTTSGTHFAQNDVVWGTDIRCKPQVGSQFCSVAALSTTVGRRLNMN